MRPIRPMRPRLQRGIIILPGALTLTNLFFGMWAIVSAARGDYSRAAWLIVFAAIADTLDGRVARRTKTGSRFGEELDSLVDAISFGVAPAIIMYHLFLREGWGWIAAFFYVTAAVIRLARFNVEQAGHAKSAFHGLPSPSAGMTLATFYPFSQTDFFRTYLANWAWPEIMTGLMIVIGMLMMSHILYPVVPKIGLRSRKLIFNSIFLGTLIVLAVTIPSLYFFTASICYVAYGILKSVVLGMLERVPGEERDPLLDVDEDDVDDAGAELREISYDDIAPTRPYVPRSPGRRSEDQIEEDRP